MHRPLEAKLRGTEQPPKKTELPNGSVLLSRPTPETYGVAFGAYVKTGTRDEAHNVAGISHLTEHMVFKGTTQRSAFELARDMEAIGAHLDAYTTKEHTGYTVRAMPEVLEEALGILREMLLESTFPEDQLELEKQVVVEEILGSEDNPDDHVHEMFTEKLFGDHSLSRPILGTEQSVRGISRDDLIANSERVHRGGNIVMSAAGAVGDQELATIAKAFDFPAGKIEHSNDPRPAAVPGVWCHTHDLSQQYVELGIPALSAHDEDRFVLGMLSNILGGGMSSRLFQRVREESGLAYSIYSFGDFYRDTGLLCTSFSATPTNAQAALDIVSEEYSRLRGGDLGAEEIEMNKAQLLGSVMLGLEGSSSQMSRFARSEMLYGRFVPTQEILDAIRKITLDDILRLADRLLDPSKQTLVAYGPLKTLNFG